MISHPEKVLFPDSAITKGELCDYYEHVAPYLLPHLRGRPITLERYPAGIDKKGFIQKDVNKGFPDWLERVAVPRRAGKAEGPVHYPLVSDTRGLLWMANLNTVTPHVWSARTPHLDRPDLCVFDLDPPEDDGSALQRGALALRDSLLELGLPSFVKTSGSKGYHVVIPVDETVGYSDCWRFAQGLGRLLVNRHPDLFTQEFIKADRAGRILLDTGRNAHGATFAATYAVRAKAAAPVSAPCTWDEVESGSVAPRTFTLRNLGARLDRVGDLWRDLQSSRFPLAAALERLEARLSPRDWEEASASTTRRPKPRSRGKG